MMSKTARRRTTVLLTGIAIVALCFGMWMQHNMSKPLQLSNATVLPQPRLLTAFQLQDDQQQPFTNQNFQGHWTMVFFGFTRCPQLCPTTLSTLNQAYQKLAAANQQPMPQIVFISVDPEQDTPQKIREYLASFNKNFLGATGKKDQIDELTKELNVMYAKVATSHDKMYTIDHSGTILLLDPQGQFYAAFTTPHDADNIAKDYAAIVANYQPQSHS